MNDVAIGPQAVAQKGPRRRPETSPRAHAVRRRLRLASSRPSDDETTLATTRLHTLAHSCSDGIVAGIQPKIVGLMLGNCLSRAYT